jgi:hypothetical protein
LSHTPSFHHADGRSSLPVTEGTLVDFSKSENKGKALTFHFDVDCEIILLVFYTTEKGCGQTRAEEPCLTLFLQIRHIVDPVEQTNLKARPAVMVITPSMLLS